MSDDAYNPACMICAGACQPRYKPRLKGGELALARQFALVRF